MSPTARTAWMRIAGFLAAFTACATGALAQAPDSDPAAALRERYAALSQELENSTIQKGLYLESVERSRALSGDVLQLHEVEHDDYIAMKRRQYLRQQSVF